MRPIILCLTLLVTVAGCETSTDPFIGIGGGGAVTPAQASGDWTFVVHPTSALTCSSGSLADGQVLTATLVVIAGGSVNSSSSFWQVASPFVTGSVSGVVDLSDGRPTLNLNGSGGTAMQLAGTMTTGGSFSGTIRDPDPGSLPVFAACTYTTTGTKT